VNTTHHVTMLEKRIEVGSSIEERGEWRDGFDCACKEAREARETREAREAREARETIRTHRRLLFCIWRGRLCQTQ
jgi:hypothetical protein